MKLSAGNFIFVRSLGIAEGTGDVIAEIDSADTPHFYVANHRGDTVRVLSDDGTEVEAELRYDAFGNLVSSIPDPTSFQPRYSFSTKEYLSEVKLFLYACRVYDPVAGRWTQRDPIDYQDSVNLYQFCGNNPVMKTDADGRSATVVGFFGGAAVAFAFAYATGKRGEALVHETLKGAAAGAIAGFCVDTCGAGVAVAAAIGAGVVTAVDEGSKGNLNTKGVSRTAISAGSAAITAGFASQLPLDKVAGEALPGVASSISTEFLTLFYVDSPDAIKSNIVKTVTPYKKEQDDAIKSNP